MKKKKLTALILASAMVLCMLTGCGNTASDQSAEDAGNQPEEELEIVTIGGEDDAAAANDGGLTKAEGDTFTVGFDAEFPPYGFMDENGNYVGFDLSLAEEVCSRNGWELVKQPINWDSKDMELSSGAIDCIWNGFTINGREDDYTWSVPYVDNSQVFVVAASSGISSFDDLAGKNVGVQADSSALSALTSEEDNEENLALAASFANLTQYADYNTAFMDLESGSLDAVAMDIGVAKYQLASRNGEFVMMDQLLATEQYGIGFLLGNTALKDQVESTLLEMAADGTVDKIAAEWEDYGLSADSICLTK